MWCGLEEAVLDTDTNHSPNSDVLIRRAYPAMSPHVSITLVIFLVFIKHCCLLAQRFGRLSAAL